MKTKQQIIDNYSHDFRTQVYSEITMKGVFKDFLEEIEQVKPDKSKLPVDDFMPSPIEQPDNIIIRSTDSIGYEVDRSFWDWIDDITRTVNFLRQSKK